MARRLIETARLLIPTAPGRPRQTDLRRAASTIYYAAFHRLMECCADRLAGTSARRTLTWRRVYRSLNHARCAEACRSREVRSLPPDIRRLTTLFPTLRGRRRDADYDPAARFTKSELVRDLAMTESALDAFDRSSARDQRDLAVLLLFRERSR